jgi:hypothetical protein
MDDGSLRYITYELDNTTLLCFQPQGCLSTPLLVSNYEVSEDKAVLGFRVCTAMRCSDRHVFTADAIMFWCTGWATWKDTDTGVQLG